MSTSLTINNTPLPNEASLVCFDGTNLHYLEKLRDYFLSYNLTVIDNYKAGEACLYQIITGTADELKKINAFPIRKANRRLILAINTNIDEAHKLSSVFDAKVAIISNSILKRDDARVVFGFLFSGSERVLQIHPVSSENEIIKETTPAAKPTFSDQQNSTREKHHVNWQQKELLIDQLLKTTYQRKSRKAFPVGLFIRHTFVALVTVFCLHIGSSVLSFFLLNSLIEKPSIPLIQVTKIALRVSTVTGAAIVLPVSPFSFSTPYKRVLAISDRAYHMLDVVSKHHTTTGVIQALAEKNGSLLININQLGEVWRELAPDFSLLLSDLKVLTSSSNMVINKSPIRSRLTSTVSYLTSIQQSGNSLSFLANLYPSISGGSKNKQYLILLQNNRELRPTGGFIGTVGLLRFEQNQIKTLTIEDVYSIDGQLKGHVDPPLPIRTILNQEHWYLRDSNWSANFEDSAKKAVWFYEKSTGQSVDGVIAITLPFVEKLLNITGPLSIPEYNISVTSDSVFEHLHTTIHDSFFPGSQQKKNIITNLAYVLKNKLTGLSFAEYLKLGVLLSTSLENKNIQLFSTEAGLQEEFTSLRWSGEFPPETVCTVDSETYCLKDLFAVVEANLGVNKSNTHVERSFSRFVSLSPLELNRKDSLEWEHDINRQSVGGGDYTSYTRVYYPTGTSIQSVQVNGVQLSLQVATTSATPLPYAEILDEQPGLLTLGLALTTKQNEKTNVTVLSSQPVSFVPSSYALSVYKQPGTHSTPFTLVASLSPNYTIQKTLPGDLVANNGQITYNTKLQRDELLSVSFVSEDP